MVEACPSRHCSNSLPSVRLKTQDLISCLITYSTHWNPHSPRPFIRQSNLPQHLPRSCCCSRTRDILMDNDPLTFDFWSKVEYSCVALHAEQSRLRLIPTTILPITRIYIRTNRPQVVQRMIKVRDGRGLHGGVLVRAVELEQGPPKAPEQFT
jgi:hypothetical protein